MNRFKMIISIIAAFVLLFNTPKAYALELDTPEDEIDLEETQSYSDYSTVLLHCGNMSAIVVYHYSLSWDEGIAGWFNSASLWMRHTYYNDVQCSFSISGSSWYNSAHSTIFQKYLINGSLYTFSAHVDEWGNVSFAVTAG